jgi:hypothetical protein
MITDILEYVTSYDDVRAVLGLPSDELNDETLGLKIYLNSLNIALTRVVGTYPTDYGSTRTLVELYEALKDGDPLDEIVPIIQMYAIYSVANTVANTLPMIGVKTKSDGKSVVTRHSAESVYLDTHKSIKEALRTYSAMLRDKFGEGVTDVESLTVVTPALDVVTNS